MILHANRAPDWRPGRSEFLVVWHGRTAHDKDGIEKAGIDLSRCAADSDFGRGFYTTTLKRQAQSWAWARYYAQPRRPASARPNPPVILRFRIRRYSIPKKTLPHERGIDAFNQLAFVRGDFDDLDYWSFVQHCRQSPKSGAIHHHRRLPNHWYDLVSGPVSAMWKQRVTMTLSDQISFHTEDAIDLLGALIDKGKGKTPADPGHPDFYSWEAVV